MRMHNKFFLTIVMALLTLSLWGLEALAAPPSEHINIVFILAGTAGQARGAEKARVFLLDLGRPRRQMETASGRDKYRLYDLENDIAEKHDLADKVPEVVDRCSKYFEKAKR